MYPLVGAARDRYHSGMQEFPVCGLFTIEAHEGFDGGGPVVGAYIVISCGYTKIKFRGFGLSAWEDRRGKRSGGIRHTWAHFIGSGIVETRIG